MPIGGQSPAYELTALGLSKESSFATATTPTLWLAASDFTANPKNEGLGRMGARGRKTQSFPTTGRYQNSISMTLESTPDVLGALFSLSMGAESVVANANNPTSGSPVLAYDHTFGFASPLNSVSLQHQRITDNVMYSGAMFSQLRFAVSPTAILSAAVTASVSREALIATPNTPTYGVIEPFRFEDPGNTVTVNGAAGALDIKSFDITIATGLLAGEAVFGSGRYDTKYPEGQAKVSGSVTLKFNSDAAYQLFLGNASATSPQVTITGVSLSFYFHGKDPINANVNYGLRLTMANCFLEATSIPGRAGGMLEQSFNYTAAETVLGAGNDLVAVLTNTSSTAF